MKTSYSDPDFDATRSTGEFQDTENRDWGTFAKDVAIDALARPVLSAIRTGTQAARGVYGEDSTAADLDRWTGRQQGALKEERSPRAQALDTLSLAPGPDERSFWREPIAGSLHSILPSVPYIIAGILTGGLAGAAGVGARTGLTVASGAFGGGEAINELRDFADGPIDQLKQLPVWDDLMAKAGGDERKARHQLFLDSLDPTSLTFNFLVNALEVPAFMRGLRGGKGIAGRGVVHGAKERLLAGAEGAVLGGTQGALEGGTEAFIEEQAKVRRGEQQQIEGAAIEKGVASGAVFAGPTAAFHAIAPHYKADGPGGTGAAEAGVLADQLQPGQPRIFPDTGMPEQVPQPGQGQDVVTPEAPLPPQFPEIERPGMPDPGDFGGEESRIGPAPPFAPGTPYGQKPPPYGPPRPSRAQQLYQRQGVYEPAEPEPAPEPGAGTSINRMWRDLENLEDGQAQRAALLADDRALTQYAQRNGMTPQQARSQLTAQHADAQQQVDLLWDYLGGGPRTPAQMRARREAAAETGITPTRVRPYRETVPTGQMEEQPPVVTPEAPGAPAFPEMQAAPGEAPTAPAPTRSPIRRRGEVDEQAEGGYRPTVDEEREVEGEYTWGEVEPEPERGVSTADEDLIRSAVATHSVEQREKWAQEMVRHADRTGRLMEHHIPQQLVKGMTAAEKAALTRAINIDPQRALDIVRRPPEGLEGHPVLRELQTRQRTRREQEERAAEEKRAEARREAERAAMFPKEAPRPRDLPFKPKEKKITRGEQLRRERREKTTKRLAEQREAAERKREAIAGRRRMRLSKAYEAQKAAATAAQPQEPDDVKFARIMDALGPEPDTNLLSVRGLLGELREMNERRVASGEKPLQYTPSTRWEKFWRKWELNGPTAEPEPELKIPAPQMRQQEKPVRWTGRGKKRMRQLEKDQAYTEAARRRAAEVSQMLREGKPVGPQTAGEAPMRRPKAGITEHFERVAEQQKARAKIEITAGMRGLTKAGRDIRRAGKINWEERIRELIEERAAEARLRTARGLPPLRPETTREGKELTVKQRMARLNEEAPRLTVGGRLPSLQEAIREFREGLQREGGTKRTQGTRERYYVKREEIIATSLRKAIINRHGTEKRFQQLLDKIEVLASIPMRDVAPNSKLPEGASKEMQDWFKSVVGEAANTTVVIEGKKQVVRDVWLNAKREQAQLVHQLNTFLTYAIDRINTDLINYKNDHKITGRTIEWELAKRSVRPDGTVTFQSGTESPENAYYNFANDLQKVNETLRVASIILRDIEKGALSRNASIETREARRVGGKNKRVAVDPSRMIQQTTLREEYGRILRPVERRLVGRDRTLQTQPLKDLSAFIAGDMNAISEKRRLLLEDIDTKMREESLEARQERMGETIPKEEMEEGFTIGTEGGGDVDVRGQIISERLDPDVAVGNITMTGEEAPVRGVNADPVAAAVDKLTDEEEAFSVAATAGKGGAAERRAGVVYGKMEEERLGTPIPGGKGKRMPQSPEQRKAAVEQEARYRRIRQEFPLQSHLGRNVLGNAGRRNELLRKIRKGNLYAPRLGNVNVPIVQGLPKLPAKEQAVWDQHPAATVEELMTVDTDGRWEGGRAAASYAIHENGQLHNVNDHGSHVHNILAARDDLPAVADDGSVEDTNYLLEENPDSGRPYVHISRYTHSGLVELGIERSSSVTRQQAATIKRIVAEARKVNRAGGEDAGVSVQMDWLKLAMGLDAEGLPSNRLPDMEWQTEPLSVDQQRAIEGYNALKMPGPVVHSRVAPVETTRDAIDRVKQMLRGGIAHNLPREYINDQFLDKLAAATADVQVYHAPYDTVSHLGMEGPAFYNVRNDRVVLSNDVSPQRYMHSVIHEIAHAVEVRMLNNDPRFAEETRELYATAIAYARRQGIDTDMELRGTLYGLTNPHEFLTETQSNEQFRQFLHRIKAPEGYGIIHGAKTLLNALYKTIRDAFRRLMGVHDGDTALDVLYYDQSTVLGRTDAMIERIMDKVASEGRPMLVDRGRMFGGQGDYYISRAGTQKFIADVVGKLGETKTDLTDAASYAWATHSKNRGLGMVLHTLSDLTKRGSAEVQRLAGRLLDTVERQNHERAKILRDIDRPKLDRLHTFLNAIPDKEIAKRVQKGIVDESYHGAFADVDLNDPKNAHLFRRQTEEEKAAGAPRVFNDSLKNEQIKLDHPEMMAELRELERLAPGFMDIRKMVHGWALEREIEMRRGRIHDFLKVSGLNIPLTDRALRERVLSALERAVDVDKVQIGNTWQRALKRDDERLLRQTVGDPHTGKVKEILDKLHATEDLKLMAGPYTPFTRRGDWAVSGYFVLKTPENATMLEGGINRQTGEQIGNPRFIFKTEPEARDWIKEINDKYGIKLIKAGVIPIDTTTNQPPRGYDVDDPDNEDRLYGKRLTAAKDAGAPIEDRYYVQFQTKFLEFHESERAAARAKESWEDHAKKQKFEMKLSEPKDVLEPDGQVNERYVGQQLSNLINTAEASDAYKDLHPNERRDIHNTLKMAGQQYTMRRGIKQRYLPRGYVTGASINLLDTYMEWSGMTAGYLAKVRYSADLKERSDALRDHVKATGYDKQNALVDSRVYNEFMQRQYAPNMNPRGTWLNRMVEKGLRWTMLDKLPSIAYFTVQTTEPAVVAAPLMTDHHGPIEIAATMGSMYKIAGVSKFVREGLGDIGKAWQGKSERFRWDHLFGERVKDEVDATRLTDLYNIANDRNYFDASASLDFERQFQQSRSWDDRAADWLQGMFQAANTAIENLNRFVTIGTAYRLEFSKLTKGGMEEGAAHTAAVDYALNKAHEANGIYSAYNAPPIFGSTTLGRVVFQFKKYPQRITANYIRAMVGTVQGAGQLVRGEKVSPENIARARQLAYMLATQALVAGAMGLPTELFAVPLNTMYIAGLSPYNWDDVQAGYRQWAAKQFGVTGGEVSAHGILRLTGLDFSSRLSQSSMWTFGSPSSRKPNDLMASAATMFSGALGSTSFEFVKGIQKTVEGAKAYNNGAYSVGNDKMMEAAKNLAMFRLFTDVADAARKMSPEGMRTEAGRQMREPYGPIEAIAKAAGFTPTREAESSEARRAKDAGTKRLKAERSEWIAMWTQAQPAERAMMWPRIQQWNASQPGGDKVSRDELEKAVGRRKKAEKQPVSMLGLPTDRRSKQFENLPAAYNL